MLLSSNLSKISGETRKSQVHVKRSSPASQHHCSPHVSSKRATDFPSFLRWVASILPSCHPTMLPALCWHSGQSVRRRANWLAQVPYWRWFHPATKEKSCLLKTWATNLEELLGSNMGAVVGGKIILKNQKLIKRFLKVTVIKSRFLQSSLPASLHLHL